VLTPVKELEPKAEMRVGNADMLSKPNDFTHVQSQVGKIVNCITQH